MGGQCHQTCKRTYIFLWKRGIRTMNYVQVAFLHGITESYQQLAGSSLLVTY
jgi:hypothetical protein